MEIEQIGKIPNYNDLKLYLEQRIIPVKFCYLNNGGDNWHLLRKDEKYSLGKRELTAFNRGLSELERIIGAKPINLVHLGPGDGIEIPFLFEKFKPKDNRRYAGIDISRQMINNTLRLNNSYFFGTNPLWYITDIETEGNLARVCTGVKSKGADRNLLIASNEGTLLSNDHVFRYLRDSICEEDYLFLTLEGDDPNKREEICSTYSLPETQNVLAVGLKSAGYIAEKGRFRVGFNEAESRVEVYFKPKDEKEILCLASYKPGKEEFRTKLTESGFGIQFLKFYEDVHTFAVLCKKGGK